MSRETLALLAAFVALLAPARAAQNCTSTSTGRIPLTDLGAGAYLGFEGGLYPGGVNVAPLEHAVGGLKLAAQVRPRDAQGQPSPGGRIVVLSIGMSNAAQDWSAFQQAASVDPLRSAAVTLVQGAQAGVPAEDMDQPTDSYWTTTLPQKLAAAGVSPVEVQVVWMLQANRIPTAAFPAHAQVLQGQMESILRIAHARFPNLRLAYCAARNYAGYATTNVNPEPYAYESGFAVKWMIERQLSGDPALNFDPDRGNVVAPWIGWCAYAWADGLVARSDGLTWACSDFAADGTHPSPQGSAKNAALMLDFFRTDPTATRWYLAQPAPVRYGIPKVSSAGGLPRIGWVGEPEITQGTFRLTLSDALPQRLAILFRGFRPHSTPFLGGGLWIRQPLDRLPATFTDAQGACMRDVGLSAPMAGQTQYFQFWFRDGTHPDGTGSGLSDALAVRFRP